MVRINKAPLMCDLGAHPAYLPVGFIRAIYYLERNQLRELKEPLPRNLVTVSTVPYLTLVTSTSV